MALIYSPLTKVLIEWTMDRTTLNEEERKKIDDKINKLKWLNNLPYEKYLTQRKAREETEIWQAEEKLRKQNEKAYTIDIPGLSDIFRLPIPLLDNPELKRARIMRMMTKKSPVPETIQWVPPVINKIDDAQDILTTALWLAKPLIRRLPTRIIPYVGWALLVNDIMNIITWTLATSMTPGMTKPDMYKKVKNYKLSKRYGALRVEEFLRPSGWKRKIGDLLQAAQVPQSIIGIGIALGAIMGTLSDSTWAMYQVARGKKVVIRLPPKEDPIGKALRYIGQTPQQQFMQDILTQEDHELIVAAQNVSMGIVLSSGLKFNDERCDYILDQQFPTMIPWEKSSIEALEDAWYDLSRDDLYAPYIPKENPTIGDAIDMSLLSNYDYENNLRNIIIPEERGQILWQAWRETGIDSLVYATGWSEDEILKYTDEQKAAVLPAEYGFQLIPKQGEENLIPQWFTVVRALAYRRDRKLPAKEDFIDATNLMGWSWRPK